MNKPRLIVVFLLLLSVNCFGQQTGNSELNQTIVKNSIGIGTVLAIVISWSRNESILYALIHGAFGWLYVIFFVITREKKEKRN